MRVLVVHNLEKRSVSYYIIIGCVIECWTGMV